MKQTYAVSSVNFEIECEDTRLGKEIVSAVDDLFFLTKEYSAPEKHHFTLSFPNNEVPFQVSALASNLSVSPSLHVVKDGDDCYLLKGKTVFHLDLAENRGTAHLDTSFWEFQPKLKQELFTLSFLWLMRKHKLYGLHGNALVKDGCGLIFVGGSCSGKSTTTLSLIRNGWKYLSDDVTLLRKSQDEIEAIAFQKGFSVDPGLARCYPELEALLRDSSRNGQKRFLDLSLTYPDGRVPRCVPNVLIFPSIISEGRSRLMRLDNVTALIELCTNCGGIFVDRDMASVQIEVLKQLVYQTSHYKLLAGRDLYEEPDRILSLLPRECLC